MTNYPCEKRRSTAAMFDVKMYDLYYRFSKPRWDDGAVPPQLVELAAQVRPGRALDLGCGTGTQAIFLALQGFDVVGVDGSPTAIRRAQQKAAKAGVKPLFLVGDVTRLDLKQGPFDLGLDIGCFHGLNQAGKEAYSRGLAGATRPGSQVLLWGFDRRSPRLGLDPEGVEQLFAPSFTLIRADPCWLHGRPSHWYTLERR
jgi:SAM-dependent methyltransferase